MHNTQYLLSNIFSHAKIMKLDIDSQIRHSERMMQQRRQHCDMVTQLRLENVKQVHETENNREIARIQRELEFVAVENASLKQDNAELKKKLGLYATREEYNTLRRERDNLIAGLMDELRKSALEDACNEVNKLYKTNMSWTAVKNEDGEVEADMYRFYCNTLKTDDGKPFSVELKTRLDLKMKKLFVAPGRLQVGRQLCMLVMNQKRKERLKQNRLSSSFSLENENPFDLWLPLLLEDNALIIFNFHDRMVSVWPTHMHSAFYETDGYIVMKHDLQTSTYHIHMWNGNRFGDGQYLSTYTPQLDSTLRRLCSNSNAQEHSEEIKIEHHNEQQEHESARFVSYFKQGLLQVWTGERQPTTTSGKDFLVHNIRLMEMMSIGEQEDIRAYQVECVPGSISSKGAYVLDVYSMVFVYAGEQSLPEHKNAAQQLSAMIKESRGDMCDVFQVSGTNPNIFWKIIGCVPDAVLDSPMLCNGVRESSECETITEARPNKSG